MAVEMKIPAVGESISEVTISKWLKAEGEFVKMDEVICELESDKATFELNAEVSGILSIIAQEGETVSIGALVCAITPSEGAASAAPASAPAASSAAKATGKVQELVVPTVGESISEVTVANWIKGDGAFVELDEIICELESDKATFEFNATARGILRVTAEAGTAVAIGGSLGKIEIMEGGSAPVAAVSAPSAPAISTGVADYAAGHPSPAAGKILAEKGINPASVQGTGVGGRITKEDASKASVPAPKAASAPATSSAPQGERVSDRKKMTNIRKTIARRLVDVKNQTAMLTTFNEVNMKPVMELRKKYKDAFKEKNEVNLGFMSFFTKACAIALQEWPAVNAYIDGEDIVYNNFVDVSIAVSTPKGLVVPVIRSAEKMNFAQIEKEVIRLAKLGRDGKLGIADMEGGTFTITNGGTFGSMLSTPIINSPQSAILGMHNIVERPVVENGQIVIAPVMYLALSYDHRIIDGRESVSFLVRVKELLEDPARMLLEI